MLTECKICHVTRDNDSYVAKEMMYGLRDQFDYFECAQCGCLQILNFPANISDYYPADYDAYAQVNEKTISPLKHVLMRQLTNLYLNGIVPYRLKRWAPWLKKTGAKINSKILDVGCGTGTKLKELYEIGFLNLTGIDPFIPQNYTYYDRIHVYKKEVTQVNDKYDLIMMHHVFEHVPDPLQVLMQLNKILNPGGCVLIRIPVTGYAWRTYKTDWIQLDAPRHLFLHSQKSIELLANEAGFSIDALIYDSTGFQFYGSELYAKGIPMKEFETRNFFDSGKMAEFEQSAVQLNKKSDGDQACFYLRKSIP